MERTHLIPEFYVSGSGSTPMELYQAFHSGARSPRTDEVSTSTGRVDQL